MAALQTEGGRLVQTLRSLSIEMLVGQATVLLDRALSQRDEFNNTYERYLAALVDLWQFSRADVQANKEAIAGAFKADELEATSNRLAEEATNDGSTGASKNFFVAATNFGPNPAGSSATGESLSASGTANAASRRAEFWTYKESFEKTHTGTKRQRAEIVRSASAHRGRQFAADASPFNLLERLSDTRVRFESDFPGAWARCIALQKGMAIVYPDYKPRFALEALDESSATAERRSATIDELQSWLRDVNDFLLRIATREQSYVLSIQLRPFLGDVAKWEAGLIGPSGRSGQWTFTLTHDMFEGEKYLRFRGLSVYSRTDDDRLLLSALIAPPRSSAPLKVGRILDRRSPHEADLVGTVSASNLSPIGTWSVAVSDQPQLLRGLRRDGKGSAASATLNDLVLDLHISSVHETLPSG